MLNYYFRRVVARKYVITPLVLWVGAVYLGEINGAIYSHVGPLLGVAITRVYYGTSGVTTVRSVYYGGDSTSGATGVIGVAITQCLLWYKWRNYSTGVYWSLFIVITTLVA